MDEQALWVCEAEEAVGLADFFVFDVDEGGSPEGEVVETAEAYEAVYNGLAVFGGGFDVHAVDEECVDAFVTQEFFDEWV